MSKTIYIAGKVSGEPIAECTLKFGAAQKEIEAQGYRAINPLAVVNDWHCPWDKAMRLCLKAMLDADAVLALPDWQLSRGASIEIIIANHLNIKVYNRVSDIIRSQRLAALRWPPKEKLIINRELSGGYCKTAVSRWPFSQYK